MPGGRDATFGETADAIHAKTAYVSGGFFPVLGTRPLLGRTLGEAEQEPGRNATVMVSHGFWRSQLGGDPRVVGSTIRLGGAPYTVAGVMPADFAFPEPDVAVWAPQTLMDENDVGPGRASR